MSQLARLLGRISPEVALAETARRRLYSGGLYARSPDGIVAVSLEKRLIARTYRRYEVQLRLITGLRCDVLPHMLGRVFYPINLRLRDLFRYRDMRRNS